MKYQVVLIAEDGEYCQGEFNSELEAYNYLVVNRCYYGEGQELIIEPVHSNNYYH